MGEFFGFLIRFFHGWRRKAGCVTLLLACVSLFALIRSIVSGDDLIEFPIDDTNKYVAGFPPAGFWVTKQKLKIYYFNNGGSGGDIEYMWIWVLPYWYVIAPLTLLSAYLLVKPRVAKPKLAGEK